MTTLLATLLVKGVSQSYCVMLGTLKKSTKKSSPYFHKYASRQHYMRQNVFACGYMPIYDH
uniref:Uncharacterized protein n=1 Tax=Rhizophora mucronata TaxID=61149 RepID=A0A2P2QS08_RHIMU